MNSTALRRRVESELEFGLFAVIDAEPLHEQRGEARAGAAAERVEHQELLDNVKVNAKVDANVNAKGNH